MKAKFMLIALFLVIFVLANQSVLAQAELVERFETLVNSLYEMVLSPDGQTLATSNCITIIDGNCRGSELVLWDTETGDRLETIKLDDKFLTLDFHPNGRSLAIGTDDGRLLWWDMHNGIRQTYAGHEDSISSVHFNPNGDILVSTSLDNTAVLWNTETGEKLHTLMPHDGWVYDADFSPDGQTLVTVGCIGDIVECDAQVVLWDTETGEILWQQDPQQNSIFSVVFSQNGQQILTGGFDTVIVIWDAATGEEIIEFSGHYRPVTDVAFHPTASIIATASFDNTVILWDAETGELLETLDEHFTHVSKIAFNADGTRLYVGANRVIVWDTSVSISNES